MRTSSSDRDERGAIAVVAALVSVVLFGFAALAVDVAQLVNEKQELHDTLDMAAQTGAGMLPADGDGARAAALANAGNNDPDATPEIDFFCVVGSKPSGGGHAVETAHIPLSCDPGPPPYTGVSCDASICAIPCFPAQGGLCNTLRARDDKVVPFVFGPVISIDEGDTGTLTSVACKGACGSVPPNPMDLVVVGDRTGSMGSTIDDLEDAIEGLLEFLSPELHHVALGTIGRSSSSAPASCPSRPSGSRSSGPWIAAGFSSSYDTTDVEPPTRPPALSSSDPLARAVGCISETNSSTGTYLAAPMRAARELLAGATSRPAPVHKAIIFMTDGEPNESTNPGDGYPYSRNGTTACQNAVDEASSAKAAGVLVVTIAFRLEDVRCDGGGSPFVTSRLAAMASPRSDGTASLDDGGGAGPGCNTTAKVDGENADGDYFFCTPTPSALAPIFQTAASQIVQSTRLIRLP